MRILDSLNTLVFPFASWNISSSPPSSSLPPMTTGDASQTHPTFLPRPYPHGASAKDFLPLLPLLPPRASPQIWQVPRAGNSTSSKATRSRFTAPLRPARTPTHHTQPGASPTPAHLTICGPLHYTRPHLARLRLLRRSPTTSYRQSIPPSAPSLPHQHPHWHWHRRP